MLPQRWNGMAIHDLLSSGRALGSLHAILLWIALPTDPAATVVIPYISSVSEAVRRILSPLNIRTCFRPNVSLRDILTRAKDAVDPEKKAGVIYKIPCVHTHL